MFCMVTVALAVAWAESDPKLALTVVDMMDREADKAEAMRAIAVASGGESDFERALNLALAARVRGAELAPAEASLKLGQAFNPKDVAKADAAFNQARPGHRHRCRGAIDISVAWAAAISSFIE